MGNYMCQVCSGSFERGSTFGPVPKYCTPCKRSKDSRKSHDRVKAKRLDRIGRRLVEQGGKCAGCLKPLDLTDIHEDHDHRCCKTAPGCNRCYRGLLHSGCNKSLGLMYDDPDSLRRLADYLERTEVNA